MFTGRWIIMILYQSNQSTTTVANARPALGWHRSPLTAAGRRPLSTPPISSAGSPYTAKCSLTRFPGSGSSITLLKLTWMKLPHCAFMPLMTKVILHIILPVIVEKNSHCCSRKSRYPAYALIKSAFKNRDTAFALVNLACALWMWLPCSYCLLNFPNIHEVNSM